MSSRRPGPWPISPRRCARTCGPGRKHGERGRDHQQRHRGQRLEGADPVGEATEQRRAGEWYGTAYRRAKADQRIRSTLEIRPGGEAAGMALGEVLAHGEGTAQAQAVLTRLRRRLGRQPDLVAACDLVCGEERTPREAAGGEREALRLAVQDARKSHIVELRYFGGLTVEETAEFLKLSQRTVEREWTAAKAWLYRELSEEET